MAGDILEEWDDAFLEQLIEVEEIALTSTNPTQTHPPLPQPHPKPSHYPLKKSYPAPVYGGDSYSPPRELSQRVPDGNKKGDFDVGFSSIGHTVLAPVLPRVNDVKKKDSNLGFVPSHLGSRNPQDDEIDRLKRELSRVSKQLTSMEQDCVLLRKERDKKEEQLKFVFSSSEAKVAEIHDTKSKNSEYGVHTHGDPGSSAYVQNGISSIQVGSRVDTGTPSRKEVGIQTDQCGECPKQFIRDDLSTPQRSRNKLLGIWNSPSDRGSFSNLVSTLLVVCEADFHVLFGWLSISTKRKMSSASDERYFNMGLHCDKAAPQSAEATKVSRLYSMLIQIGTGMVKLESFFEALVDLCSLENEVIVYRSLHVLHRALNHVYTPETNVRDNVIVEEIPPRVETEACSSNFPARQHHFPTDGDEMDITCLNTCETRLSDGERLFKQKPRNRGSALSTTLLDWVSVFKLMHQIAMRKTDECLRLEAVSVMNVILRRSNAYSEREQFANLLGFQSVSHLLRKESGVCVQKEAVHLLYLILNCPKLFDNFCLGCKEEVKGAEVGTSDIRAASTVQGFSSILDGLADCLACDGNGTQELKLRRISVTVLSFLSSSSHLGFEIMLNHSLRERNNFLALILHMLISEMDAEAANSSHPSETFKERTLLVREALILLNRLVSNPPYATPVLQVLTNSRVVACLTVDVANRLSCKVKWVWQNDGITRQIRESEIVNLARGFKNRIFTFLGDRDSEHS